MAGHIPRWLVNLFLVGFLAVLAIDTVHKSGWNASLKEKINLPLVVTGLWQGPWRLYAPDVDKDNLRLKADVMFADGEIATWSSPDWPRLSAFGKFVRARHINYLNHILQSGRELEWDDLCAYLARTLRHPAGRPAPVVQVTLSLRGARIPAPDERPLPAGPHLTFDDWNVIHVWRPGT